MTDPIEALEAEKELYRELLYATLDMIRDEEDRYGIGNMMSQWTGPEIAEDIIERLGITGTKEED